MTFYKGKQAFEKLKYQPTIRVFTNLDIEGGEERPRTSTIVRPLQNLPVGPLGKSIPFGGKLALPSVTSLLLLPLSDNESPNMK